MKNTSFIIAGMAAVMIFAAACSTSPEKKIPGEWRVEEVSIEADTSVVDPSRVEALKSMERSVFFILEEDKSLQAITGNTTLDGAWSYESETGEIYVSFIGTGEGDMNLFGIFEDGKIVKSYESGGIKIKTIYTKE